MEDNEETNELIERLAMRIERASNDSLRGIATWIESTMNMREDNNDALSNRQISAMIAARCIVSSGIVKIGG